MTFRSARHYIPMLLSVILPLGAMAQEAMVRTHLQGKDPLWAGQRVSLIVELLAPGYFASAASFDLPDPDGVLLMPPADHPIVDSLTIDGTHYSVQRHELNLWAVRDGDLEIPPIHARFRYKRHPLDKEPATAAVTTEAVAFSVQRPPGTEGLGLVISARDLKVEEQWQPQPGDEPVMAGTAFKRSIRFSAADVPGMVFPPFPDAEIDGLGIYTKQQVRDRSNRGTLTGTREDTITYLAKRPGQYTIPAVRFQWFDLSTRQVQTQDFPARTLNVIANPDQAASEDASNGDRVAGLDQRTAAYAFAGLVALGLLGLLAFRNAARILAPFRPVHLQPLNPTEQRRSKPRAETRHKRA
ncbi:BatD family protein [Parahaliea aestuarii]|uniref:Protein BatD n=1 Tax=Parahaliea aestuarii TaxID=1852021 RepID=A0A5C8ZMC4_9GAMM|nr:BatD family protein [Parahaliea aestuarii]TXS89335.1 protein BatD [Parahaliea aestuarii]